MTASVPTNYQYFFYISYVQYISGFHLYPYPMYTQCVMILGYCYCAVTAKAVPTVSTSVTITLACKPAQKI